MARPKPSEPMKPVGITIPESWVKTLTERGIENFSEYIRQLIEADIKANAIETPQKIRERDIQTNILEYCEKGYPHRNLVREFFSNARGLSADAEIREYLINHYSIPTTSQDISIAMSCIKCLNGGWIDDGRGSIDDDRYD